MKSSEIEALGLEITTIPEALKDFVEEFAKELLPMKEQLKLTDESKICIVNEDGNDDEYLKIARDVGITEYSDDELVIESHDELMQRGWQKITLPDDCDTVSFHKDGFVYSFAKSRENWFPAIIIVIIEKEEENDS